MLSANCDKLRPLIVGLVSSAIWIQSAFAQRNTLPLRAPFTFDVLAAREVKLPPQLKRAVDGAALDYEDSDALRGARVHLRAAHVDYLIVSSERECGNAGCPVVLLDEYRGKASMAGQFFGSRLRGLRDTVSGWTVLEVDGSRFVMKHGRYEAAVAREP